MADITHEQVPTNGIELHVAAAGPADGPPVVLCHGFPELWYSWRHQLGALGDAGYRAYAPDLRGYGGSSHPTEVTDYGSDKLTGDLCGLLDHYGHNTAATRHSYELIARYVAPRFQDSADSLTRSRDWAAENRPEFIGAAGNAVMSAIQKHHEEKADKAATAGDKAADKAEEKVTPNG